MSDLAPFVAAVLKDKVVVDLKEEVDRLKEFKAERARALDSARWGGCVEITGEGGSPVYARGRMEEIRMEEIRMEEIYHDVEDDDSDKHNFCLRWKDQLLKCPISKAFSAEVRVNGIKIANVGDYDEHDLWMRVLEDGDYEGERAFYTFKGGRGTPWGDLSYLRCCGLGPFPEVGTGIGLRPQMISGTKTM